MNRKNIDFLGNNKEEFLKARFDFLKQNGYRAVLHSNSYSNEAVRHEGYFIHEDFIKYQKNQVTDFFSNYKRAIRYYDEDYYAGYYLELLTPLAKNINQEEEIIKFKKVLNSFAMEYIKDNKSKIKILINNYSLLFNDKIEKNITSILEQLFSFNDKKDIMKMILNIDRGNFEIQDLNFKKLKELLTKEELGEFFIDSFLLELAKKHQKTLNNVKFAPMFRDTMVEIYRYENEKLKLYSEYFPIIKKEFNKDLSFITSNKYSQFITFDTKVMIKTLAVDGWDLSNYVSCIEDYFQEQRKVYKIPHGIITKTKSIYKVSISHNLEELTQEKFEKDFLRFCAFISKDPNFKPTTENINKWIHGDKLNSELKDNDQLKAIKLKL